MGFHSLEARAWLLEQQLEATKPLQHHRNSAYTALFCPPWSTGYHPGELLASVTGPLARGYKALHIHRNRPTSTHPGAKYTIPGKLKPDHRTLDLASMSI
jgi:hypothetical protein